MCACKHVFIYASSYLFMFVCIHRCMHKCVHVYMCVCVNLKCFHLPIYSFIHVFYRSIINLCYSNMQVDFLAVSSFGAVAQLCSASNCCKNRFLETIVASGKDPYKLLWYSPTGPTNSYGFGIYK